MGIKKTGWLPQEEAKVLHIIERAVLDEKLTIEDAFDKCAEDEELKKADRTAGAVKYRWNKKLRVQATGRLGEWVKQNTAYSNRGSQLGSSIPVIKPSSRRAQLLSLLTLANNELEGIDGKIDQAVETVQMLYNRKGELANNMKGLMREFEDLTSTNETAEVTSGSQVDSEDAKKDIASA